MWDLIDHFKLVALYAVIPLIIFSFLNVVAATAIAYYTRVNLADAQLFGLSFGGIGVAVGLLMGLSRDSVVGAVVPALLTFLSTFAVYQFGKSAYQKWRPILPIALFCLIFGTVCAAVFGASERNSYVERTRRYEEWRIQYEKLEIPTRVKQVEKKLGLTPDKPKDPK